VNARPGPKRKPGAQPGNLNAVKHGLYTRYLRSGEASPSEALEARSLEPEISLLRVLIQRTLALAEEVEDVEMSIKLLSALSLTASRLALLMRAQQALPASSGSKDALTQALEAFSKEWGLL